MIKVCCLISCILLLCVLVSSLGSSLATRLVCFTLILYFTVTVHFCCIVTAQQHSSIVIAHPGQDVELSCDVTPSGSGLVAWAIGNTGPYGLSAIRNGIVPGYTNDLNRNNLIITSIMMDDDRNDTEYQCVIAIPGAAPSTLVPTESGNVTVLYVAGE